MGRDTKSTTPTVGSTPGRDIATVPVLDAPRRVPRALLIGLGLERIDYCRLMRALFDAHQYTVVENLEGYVVAVRERGESP